MTASPKTQPHCRLACLFAREARRAVIFRRGPAKATRLIAWDLETDTFEPGQWFRGSVYPERSDISADGEWLLVFMGNFRGALGTWTVLSRPPYFTAVALWPKGDTWGGGGHFLGRDEIVLRHGPDAARPLIGALPKRFRLHGTTPETEERIARFRAADPRGWHREAGEALAWRRQQGDVSLTASWRQGLRSWDGPVYDVAGPRTRFTLRGIGWADLDRNGDLLFSVAGCLHRLAARHLAEVEGWPDVVAGSRLLADFGAMRFQAIPAPYGAPARGAADPDDSTMAQGFQPALDRVSKEDRRARRVARLGGRRR